MKDLYQKIADFYDEAMLAGYYDYKSSALSLGQIIKKNFKVAEIGVGTGLFLEQLCKIKPESQYYGIDYSDKMLKYAKRRLYDTVKLFNEDVLSMQLNEKFDVIFSHGGTWAF